MESVPTETRKLRACLLCSMVKTVAQFRQDGCDNCENILRLKGNLDRVFECTSSSFSGVIGNINNTKLNDSWVCKWQKIEKFVPGVYAMTVQGRLPEDVQILLERKGLTYRPRDAQI